MAESDSDDDIKKSNYPMVPVELTIFKKSSNYLKWLAQPELIVSDLAHCRARVLQAKSQYDSWEQDQERWAECMEVARTKLFNSYNACVGTFLLIYLTLSFP